MSLTDVPVSPISLDRYRDVLTPERWEQIEVAREHARETLAGRVVWNVNSTAHGGGVAEMLHPLLAYGRGAGIDARWMVIGGDAEFFRITKRLHNRLHGYPGDGGPLGEAEHELYRRTLEESARELRELAAPGDMALLHDPQTAGLIPALHDGVRVVWRSHIGRDAPNRFSEEGWDFLLPYIRSADAWVFSRPEYAPAQLDRSRITIVPPSIDVFSPKNADLDDATAAAIMTAAGLAEDDEGGMPVFTRTDGSPGRVVRRADLGGAPPPPPGARLVTQVSRWDRLKDPVGVLEGFIRHVVPRAPDVHLVLAGPDTAAVSDDPEGEEVLGQVRAIRLQAPELVRARIHLACLPMDDSEENAVIVNALQRRSTIVVQKSLAEGFGLTVGEAMWKGRPVVASAVGGIRDQIEDGVSGVLLEDPADLEAFGAAVAGLLADPPRAAELGRNARERVRDHFLNVRHLIQYAGLLERLAAGR